MSDSSVQSPSSGEILSPSHLSVAANHSLTSVLSIKSLFQVIFEKLHQLYAVDCAVLVLYDSELTTIVDSYISCLSADDEVNTETVSEHVSLSFIPEVIARLEFPILKTKEEWTEQFKENHCLLNGDSSYHYHCYIPLEADHRLVGTLELHNYTRELSKECLGYCTNMTDFLGDCINRAGSGTPVAETAATPEYTMIAGNEDYERLLALVCDIASIKGRERLARAVNYRFNELFFLNDLVIATPNADGETHSAFLIVTETEKKNHEAFIRASAGKYLIKDQIYEVIAASQVPVVFHMESLLTREMVPDYVHYWHAQQIKEIIGIALRDGEEVTGILYLHLKETCQINESHFPMLQRIAAQLSISLVNVLAYEKIQQQLTEINVYRQQLEEEKLYLQEEIQTHNQYTELIGEGAKMQDVFNLLGQVADTETTVLILGETGTGKELIARAIHQGSARHDKLMIKVNCAAIPPNLIESELFGHEKGSFTGATERRLGKFELANNSTLFLDEIGELSLDLQVKLLRALQEKEIERVGGRTVISTDVRIVSATNRNLAEEVEAGRFRRDLFYRLNVFPVSLPALRDRKEDIPLLASHFLSQFSQKTGKNLTGFSQRALQDMMKYDWPGNVRELEHLIERQVVLAKGTVIKSIDVPSPAQQMVIQDGEAAPVKTIFENERDHIFSVLKLCKGKVSGNDGAAKLLGVPATTLNSKIKRLALSKKHIF